MIPSFGVTLAAGSWPWPNLLLLCTAKEGEISFAQPFIVHRPSFIVHRLSSIVHPIPSHHLLPLHSLIIAVPCQRGKKEVLAACCSLVGTQRGPRRSQCSPLYHYPCKCLQPKPPAIYQLGCCISHLPQTLTITTTTSWVSAASTED